jgi:outer membrane protein OmpU
MKKIIAMAVAGAFVAPVMAADITVGGYAEYAYTDNETASATSTTVGHDTNLKVNATDELANGMTISAALNVNQSGGTESQSVSLSGEFGKVTLGDTSGAIDSVDGGADPFYVVARVDADEVAFGGDAGASWSLPAMMPGLSVLLTHTPENGSTGAISDTNGFAVSYATSGVTVAYADEEVAGLGKTFAGIKGTFSGLTVAIESVSEEQSAAADIDTQAIGAQYAMGDVTFAVTSAEVDQAGTLASERQSLAIHYTMGPAVFFAEQTSDDVDSDDTTAIGVAYTF